MGYTFIAWGTKPCAGVQYNAGGYKIYSRGTCSKLLLRIVSIITTIPKKLESAFAGSSFLFGVMGFERPLEKHAGGMFLGRGKIHGLMCDLMSRDMDDDAAKRIGFISNIV